MSDECTRSASKRYREDGNDAEDNHRQVKRKRYIKKVNTEKKEFRIGNKQIGLVYKLDLDYSQSFNKIHLAEYLKDNCNEKTIVDLYIAKHKAEQLEFHVYINYKNTLYTRDRHYFDLHINNQVITPTDIIKGFQKTYYIENLVKLDTNWYEEGKDAEVYVKARALNTSYRKLRHIEKIRADPFKKGLLDEIDDEDPSAMDKWENDFVRLRTFYKAKYKRRENKIGFRELPSDEIDQLEHYCNRVIANWYNERLVHKRYDRSLALLHLVSTDEFNLAKTAFGELLLDIAKGYTWTYKDGSGWQQGYDNDENYEFILFHALNEPNVDFHIFEQLADGTGVKISKRFQKEETVIPPEISCIIDGNKYLHTIYSNEPKALYIYGTRTLIVNVDNHMGELLDLIRRVHDLPSYEDVCKTKKIDNQVLNEHIQSQYKLLGITLPDE